MRDDEEPRFNQQEVALVLKRAGELQKAAEGEAGDLSLAELERLAQEVGMDPRHLRQAAMELREQRGGPAGGLLGAPVRLRWERTLPGSLPTEAFEDLLEEIRRDQPVGHASLTGRTLTWTTTPIDRGGPGRARSVVVSSSGGKTRLYIEERLDAAAGGLYGGIVGGGGIGIGTMAIPFGLLVLHSPWLAALLFLTVLALCYGGARALFTSLAARRRAELHALGERLCQRLTSAAAAPQLPAAAPAAASAIAAPAAAALTDRGGRSG